MSKDKLCVGVIGLGYWGPNIVRNLAAHRSVDLAYVCDLSSYRFKRVEGFVPDSCKFVTDASSVINAPEVDAVAIVTPASTHSSLVKEAIRAKKHVLCEKPMSLDVGEGEAICASAEEAGLKLMVGYTFIFNKAVRHLKKLIDAEKLGELYYLSATRTHLGLIRQDVDVSWDLAPHDVSIMNYALDAVPERVSAAGASPLGSGRHDVAFITLFYPKGVIGQIHVSWVDSNKERVVRVVGSKARVVFDDLNGLEPLRVYEKGIGVSNKAEPDFGEFRYLLRDGDIVSPKIEMCEPLASMVDSFVNVVLNDGENISSGRFALKITRTLSAIQKSLAKNGAPVEV